MLSGARAADWQTRLAKYIRERRHKPLKWGANDCAMFACGGIEAMTGINPAKPFEGYSTRLGGDKKLRQQGYKTLKEAAVDVLPACGFAPVEPAFAQRGDVVLVETERGHCLGLVSLGVSELMIADTNGLAFVEQGLAVLAWRV